MEKFKLEFTTSALKYLHSLPAKDVSRIMEKIQKLTLDQYPIGCKKLSGEVNVYRLRIGDYRVIYEVHRNRILIIMLKIGHRKDVYR